MGVLRPPQPAKPPPDDPFLFGHLPLLPAAGSDSRRGQSASCRVGALLECRQQGWRLAADLGRELARRLRGLEKLVSTPLLTGIGRLVGRRLIALGLALIFSGPLLVAL